LWFATVVGVVIGVIFGTASVAVGRTDEAGRPLVVAVEVGPGAGTDVGQARAAIARELGRPIVAFVDGAAAATDETDLLVVGLSRERITMSLRRGFEAPVARSVPSPADGAARLRAIAWLAGNVVRDQVSPFLRASADLAESSLPLEAQAAKQEAPAPEPRTIPDTEPPPLEAPPLPRAEMVATKASAPAGRAGGSWSVVVASGPTLELDLALAGWFTQLPLAFQAEVVRHRRDRWHWGVGADVGSSGMRFGGLAALGGIEGGWGKLRLEGSAGLGLQLASVRRISTTYVSSSTEIPSSETTITASPALFIYARAFVTLSYAVTPTWDLLLRVGGQMPFAETLGGPLVTAALGVRYNLL
jgi:hypothetical protein